MDRVADGMKLEGARRYRLHRGDLVRHATGGEWHVVLQSTFL